MKINKRGIQMEKLLTSEEIAEMLHITPRSVTRFLKREKLGHKVGRRIYVKESELNEYLEKKRL